MFTEKDKQRFHAKYVRAESGCWEWTGYVNKSLGYGEFFWSRKKGYAHRFSYLIHKGEIPDGKLVCHTCDNRKCVNPEHLWLGSISENIKDMWEKGRQVFGDQRGEKNGCAKLTESDVKAIRQSRESQRAIAEKYGISQAMVHLIKSRKKWAHID
ncbi:MAG TPA: HNH endonuclease [Terriglobales bacterium]|nr:HNH endonuclease [Terriglobales bacterium]